MHTPLSQQVTYTPPGHWKEGEVRNAWRDHLMRQLRGEITCCAKCHFAIDLTARKRPRKCPRCETKVPR